MQKNFVDVNTLSAMEEVLKTEEFALFNFVCPLYDGNWFVS